MKFDLNRVGRYWEDLSIDMHDETFLRADSGVTTCVQQDVHVIAMSCAKELRQQREESEPAHGTQQADIQPAIVGLSVRSQAQTAA